MNAEIRWQSLSTLLGVHLCWIEPCVMTCALAIEAEQARLQRGLQEATPFFPEDEIRANVFGYLTLTEIRGRHVRTLWRRDIPKQRNVSGTLHDTQERWQKFDHMAFSARMNCLIMSATGAHHTNLVRPRVD